jgi:hypothetical protein
LERSDELALVDQADLKREQSEEQITIHGGGWHGPGLRKGGRVLWAFGTQGLAPAACTHWIGWIIS